MEIELDEPPERSEWPEGITVRPFRRGADDRALYDAHQDAFRDSWDFQPEPYGEWRHYFLESEVADRDLYFLATAHDEIAGFAVCRVRVRDERELGWVTLLGVRRPWRRRGLGLALLRHSFGEFHRRGLSRVGLGVDAASPTGAVGLYERAGMRVVQRRDTYEKPLVRVRP